MKVTAVVGALVAAALLSAASVTASPGGASWTYGDADILGAVHLSDGVASVHVRYSCVVGDHMWVSVKQSADREIDPAITEEGSGYGHVAADWWQSHANAFTCDGQVHVQWWTAGTAEFFRGDITPGWAWVQFCITHGDRQLSVARYEWDQVVEN